MLRTILEHLLQRTKPPATDRQAIFSANLQLMMVLLSLPGLWALSATTAAIDAQAVSPQTIEVPAAAEINWGQRYHTDIQPLLENRCVVCHGCYDAPCQLKLSSVDGIRRGASKAQVYDGKRLLEAQPTRLNVDATTTEQWRDKGFFSVIGDDKRQTPTTQPLQTNLIYRMLNLKQQHPLPEQPLLPESFTLGINREQVCTKPDEFERYASKQPLWGMPYGLPGLEPQEHTLIRDWLAAGAPMAPAAALTDTIKRQVDHWEAFFNQPSRKGQLISRYLYEHLFLAHLYFSDVTDSPFFELVRSTTPPGEPIRIIASRRPYDDPGTDTVYYRLRQVGDTLLAKTHMPYALNSERQNRWYDWFYRPGFIVDQLPSYDPETASNPFVTFRDLPVDARYRFMLDEAEFTIMGFIKGPVCRGQVALNVIRDRFWVVFKDPDVHTPSDSARFLAAQDQYLRLPAEAENTLLPLGRWLSYSHMQRQYLEAKYQTANQLLEADRIKLNLDLIWDGDGHNPNAALTVFRHFDSATVVKGFVGETPQTLWVVDYPILERIHYLLAACRT